LEWEANLKKWANFFKDEKLSLIEKENVWILWSVKQLFWGIRQDDRFRVSDTTKHIKNTIRIMRKIILLLAFLALPM
jgi:hypothetical protein